MGFNCIYDFMYHDVVVSIIIWLSERVHLKTFDIDYDLNQFTTKRVSVKYPDSSAVDSVSIYF